MNILLPAYETETFSLTHIAKHLKSLGHTTRILVGDATHITNETDIIGYMQQNDFNNWSSFDDQYAKLYDTDHEVDWSYLQNFEKEYCKTKNLNQLVLTDPVIARHHHYRDPYYTPIESEETQYYWVELLLRWIEQEISEFEPDLIFNYRRNYFVKNAVAQIALSSGIPIRTLVHSRIDSLHYLCQNFGYGTDQRVLDYIKNTDSDCTPAEEYMSEFAAEAGNDGLYNSRSQKRIDGKSLYSTADIILDLARNLKNVISGKIRGHKQNYSTENSGNLFDSYTPAVIYHYTRISANRLRYNFSNRFNNAIPDRKYIYFPLHTLPESATLTLSTAYFEGDIIRHISNKLPAGMVLAVKENPNMIGERPWDFYTELETTPNIRLIDPMVPSKELISNACGVAGISGTALLEAGILNTPSHAFGTPEFSAFVDSKGWDGFGEFAKRCASGANAKYTDQIKKYIQYAIDNGVDLSMQKLRNEPNTTEFKQGIDTVNQLLKAACLSLEIGDIDQNEL